MISIKIEYGFFLLSRISCFRQIFVVHNLSVNLFLPSIFILSTCKSENAHTHNLYVFQRSLFTAAFLFR